MDTLSLDQNEKNPKNFERKCKLDKNKRKLKMHLSFMYSYDSNFVCELNAKYL